MTPRLRIEAAMQRREPDRVPLWCTLSLGHILRQGFPQGRPPQTIAELTAAECALTRRYGFDGMVLYCPLAPIETELPSSLEAAASLPPAPGPGKSLAEAAPDSWERPAPPPDTPARTSCDLAREILGPDYHIGGWTADGYSFAVQWFASLEEAMIALLECPDRFQALVEYFDCVSVASALAQSRRGLDSLHISSPYAGSSFISREAYERFVLPSVRRIVAAPRPPGAFTYLHTCGFIGDRLEMMADTGVDGIECMDPPPLGDVELAEAKRRIGDRVFLKGNLDSVNLLLRGRDDEVREKVLECLRAGMPGGGYILSTACSVAPEVAPGRLRGLRPLVEEFGRYG
jgi:uroporphyrinogen-III decarboxylase